MNDPVARYLAQYGDPDDPVARYLSQGEEPDPDEDEPLWKRLARNLGQGATQATIAMSRVNPATYLVPGQRENLRRVEERQAELKGDPEGALENIAYYGGRIAPEVLTGIGAAAGTKAVGIGSRLARAAVSNIPSALTFGSSKEEALLPSDNPAVRIGAEYGANLLGEGAFSLAGRALRAVRGGRAVAGAVDEAVQPGAVDEIAARPPSETVAPAIPETGRPFTARAYHGSSYLDIKEVDPRKAVETEGAAFFTDNPDVAEIFRYPREYGEVLFDEEPGVLIEATVNMKNPLVLSGEQAQKFTDDTTYQGQVVRQAKAAGHDGIVVRDVKEGVGDVTERGSTFAVFDKSQIAIGPTEPPPSEAIGKSLEDLTAGLRGKTASGAKEILSEEVERQQRALSVAQQAEINPDDYMNMERFGGLSQRAYDRLRGKMREVVAEAGLHPKQTVPNRKTIAKSFGVDLEDVMEMDPERLNAEEMLAVARAVIETDDEIASVVHRAAKAGTPAEQLALEAEADALRQDMGDYLLTTTKAGTAKGRDLQSLKIVARRSRDPFVWFYHAKRQLGDNPLTDEMRANIKTYLREKRYSELADYVAGFRQPTRTEGLTNLFRTNILTAPITALTNFTGNTLKQAFHVAEDPAALFWDRAIGAFDGLQTRDPSLRSILGPLGRGAKTGAGRALKFAQDFRHPFRRPGPAGGLRAPLRGQFDEIPALADIKGVDELAKFDQVRRTRYNNAFLDAYTNTVYRTLNDPDAVASQMSAVRSLEEQARLLAKKGLGEGDTFRDRVAWLRKNPTDEMSLQAIADAAYDTFREETGFGTGFSKIREGLGDVAGDLVGKPVGEFVAQTTIPFTRTIGAIARQGIRDYTPLGAIRSIGDVRKLARAAIAGAPDEELHRKVVDALARSTSGTGVLLIGAYLMSIGRMTGPAPRNEAERNAFYDEGKIPWAVKAFGEWRSAERISPLGNVLINGGQVYQNLTDPEMTASQKIGGSAQAMGSMILQSPLLTGTNQLIETASGQRQSGLAARAGSVAGNMVPFASALRAVSRGVDPTIREKESFTDELQSGIPFLSRRLPARVGPLGEEAQRPGGIGYQLLDIFRSSPDKLDSDTLLAALHESGITIGGRDKLPDESPEEYEQRMRDEGAQIKQMLEYAQEAGVLTPEYAPVIEREISNLRSSMTEDAKLRRAMRALGVSVP